MPEIEILKAEDLSKLNNCTILTAEALPPGPQPGCVLTLSHPYASVPIKLTIYAHVAMDIISKGGTQVTIEATPQISFRSEDVNEELPSQ